MKYYGLWLLSAALILSACKTDKEKTAADETVKEVQKREEKQEKTLANTDAINLEVTEESLLSLPHGTLMDDLTYEKDIEAIEVIPKTDPKLLQEMTPILEELTKEAKDTDSLKKGLISLLASPNYKNIIEKSNGYKPDFEEPYLPDPTKSEPKEEDKKAREQAIILLDASSSIFLQADGKVKMDIAKSAVKSFAQTIGQSSDVSLVVYGHKGTEADTDKEISCSGVEEVYPMGKYSKKEFHQAVDSFESKGWTPLAGAIQKATEMA